MARKSRKRNRNASRPQVSEAAQTETLVDEPKSETPVIQTDPVIEAIAANTALIQQLLDQVGHQDHEPDSIASDLENGISDEQLHDEVAELRHRNDELLLELQRRQSRIDELTQQTEDLAAQVVQSGVQQTLATPQSGTSDALSWEERKQLILQQLETDTFDADEFVESIAEEINATETMAAELQSPKELLDELVSRLQRSESELAERKIEIGELRMLLDQQSETREGGVAIGAAAIAQMVDSDELVMQERERLQTLQDQWEEKFRQSEIEASLERAKLSRERQQLAKKTEQLEEELEHLRREEKQSFDPAESGTSRRWLAKLGLSDAD
ncbi:hypothetical protein LF1_20870 [Rubripirellula obstinata]|uniref:Uncharacterized protein n=1 Tax=Rubripirellula obstinata TaxID=406547 RepID=A0A5B1CJB9_9BACT|nr:hypothetical protein LF1_20870 [Rubripirellula obstinata]